MTSDRASAPEGQEPARNPPRVFLSYSHDSDEHLERVRALADRLRADGVDAWIDQYEQAPSEGWSLWMEQQLEAADFVLCLCTERYRRRFEGKEEPGKGLGATWEGALVRTRLYLDGRAGRKFLPLLLAAEDTAHVPTLLADFSRYEIDSEAGYDSLYRLLTNQPKVTAPPIGQRQVLDPQPRQSHFGETVPGAPGTSLASPRPDYRDAHAERVSGALGEAIHQRDTLLASGLETTAVDERILDLKRDLRRGPQLQPGEYLSRNRFQLIKPLGQGGFATVWLALDRTTQELVAIKVLHGQFSSSEERRERLFRGARQMAKLEHEHIVRVLGEPEVEDGWAFFVMEYLPGGDFRRAVLDGRLRLDKRLEILEQVAGAIDHAHQQGIIHRDVKPGNILLDAYDRPTLADFDLVRAEDTTGLTRTRAAMGSYLYSAPESMEDAAGVTAHCDTYSLAATLVFATQGKELSTLFLLDRVAYLESLQLPQLALDVLRRGLSLEPTQRPDSARDLCRDFRSALGLFRRSRRAPRPVGPTGSETPEVLWRVRVAQGDIPLWRRIPAGTAAIGSSLMEPDNTPNQGPQHTVEIRSPFWLGVVPVTREQYAVFDRFHSDSEDPTKPVTEITWERAMAFCKWLDEHHGFLGARLPTEEEWEYACRAQSTTRYWSGNTRGDLERVAWYRDNSGGMPHPVGSKSSNPWGLFDMHGNVREWTASAWKADYSSQARGLRIDPKQVPPDLKPTLGTHRVIRGGGYSDPPRLVQASYRSYSAPTSARRFVGFRVLLPHEPFG